MAGLAIGIEAEPGGLRHRSTELVGRGDHLGGGVTTDPGNRLQATGPGRCGLAHGPVARGLDRTEPQTTLGRLPDPPDGHGEELFGHHGLDCTVIDLARGDPPGAW